MGEAATRKISNRSKTFWKKNKIKRRKRSLPVIRSTYQNMRNPIWKRNQSMMMIAKREKEKNKNESDSHIHSEVYCKFNVLTICSCSNEASYLFLWCKIFKLKAIWL